MQGVAAFAGQSRAAAGLVLDLVERRDDLAGLGGELAPDLQGPVIGHDHPLRASPDRLPHELFQAFEHPVAVLGLDVQVVDEEDVLRFQFRRDLCFGLGGIETDDLAVVQEHLPAGHRVEIRDLLRRSILIDLEVVPRQPGHPVPLRVGDHDLDVRHGHFDFLGNGRERLLVRRRRFLSRQRSGREQHGNESDSLQRIPPSGRQASRPPEYSPAGHPAGGRCPRARSLKKNTVALSERIQQNSALRGGPPGRQTKEGAPRRCGAHAWPWRPWSCWEQPDCPAATRSSHARKSRRATNSSRRRNTRPPSPTTRRLSASILARRNSTSSSAKPTWPCTSQAPSTPRTWSSPTTPSSASRATSPPTPTTRRSASTWCPCTWRSTATTSQSGSTRTSWRRILRISRG